MDAFTAWRRARARMSGTRDVRHSPSIRAAWLPPFSTYQSWPSGNAPRFMHIRFASRISNKRRVRAIARSP